MRRGPFPLRHGRPSLARRQKKRAAVFRPKKLRPVPRGGSARPAASPIQARLARSLFLRLLREIPGVGDDRHARACFCVYWERATDRGEATGTPRGKIADPALSRLQTQNTVRSCQKYDAKFRRRPPVFSRAAGPSVRFAPAPCSREKCLLPGMESRKTSVSVKPVDVCLFLRKACRAARSLTNRAGLFIMQVETNFPYFYGL